MQQLKSYPGYVDTVFLTEKYVFYWKGVEWWKGHKYSHPFNIKRHCSVMGNDEFVVYFVVKIIHFSLVSTHYKIIILHGLMR